MGTTVSSNLSSPEPDDGGSVGGAAGGGGTARSQAERLLQILAQRPLRMVSMLRLSRLINDCSVEEKLALFDAGVLDRMMQLIAECGSVEPPPPHKLLPDPPQLHNSETSLNNKANNGGAGNNAANSPATAQKQSLRRRRNSSLPQVKGIGYGRGSTKSRWDLERTLEERLIREEQLIWLLHGLTAYLYCASPDFGDKEEVLTKSVNRPSTHINDSVVRTLELSAIVPLFEYHLNNESVFDVSEHMELYQALLEVTCSMALWPSLLRLLLARTVNLRREVGAKSVIGDLVPKFRSVVSSYPQSFKGLMGSPDFRLVDFIQKVQRWCELLVYAVEFHKERLQRYDDADQLNPNNNAQKTTTGDIGDKPMTVPEESVGSPCSPEEGGVGLIGGSDSSPSDQVATPSSVASVPTAAAGSSSTAMAPMEPLRLHDQNLLYNKALKHLQINTWRFIGDYGKVTVTYSFKKEARNLNPFSPALKERTKRIAKELASLPSALPLNASNSIFVCVDEGRCDIMKVLISGPDDTPYQNGLFEFDVFFPQAYPFSPPKIAFLTTGNGHVRFNPNLYNDGKICLSILGTWEGRPEEKWNPYCSLLQVLISIQGLIFVKEPYFNEPGFEKYQGSDKGNVHSTRYNLQIKHATLQYAITEQFKRPPEHFRKAIQRHFWLKRQSVIEQARSWLAEMKLELTAASGAAGSADTAKTQENKKKDQSTDPMYSLHAQERNVQMLIEELNAMTCPYEDYP